jgi:hypothetical protein
MLRAPSYCLCRLPLRTPLAQPSGLRQVAHVQFRSFSRRTKAPLAEHTLARKRVAEARKAEAEALAAEVKVEAAKFSVEASAQGLADRALTLWLKKGLVGLVGLGTLWLGYDHLTHSYGPYVRWQMKLKLLKGPPDEALPKVPAHEFTVRYPSFDSGLPVLLLGRTGSGKSTILAHLARDFKSRGVPVVHFGLRALGSEKISSVARSDSKTFSSAATAVFEAIGYPPRPSLLSRLYFFLPWSLGHAGVNAEVGLEDTREAVRHFQDAVSDLFRVCRELYGERAHCKAEDRAPVILADELHDLIHNDRVKMLGGETIFRQLAAEFTSNCTDAKTVRFCAATSSFALQGELIDAVANTFRAVVVLTKDPPVEAVWQRLCGIGFSLPEAELITGTCGTRLRLLSPFLNASSAGSMDVAQELQLIVGTAQSSIKELLSLAEGNSVAQQELAALLDKLCNGGQSCSVTQSGLSRQLRTGPLASTSAAAVLHLGSGGMLELQSQPYRVAWKKMGLADEGKP